MLLLLMLLPYGVSFATCGATASIINNNISINLLILILGYLALRLHLNKISFVSVCKYKEEYGVNIKRGFIFYYTSRLFIFIFIYHTTFIFHGIFHIGLVYTYMFISNNIWYIFIYLPYLCIPLLYLFIYNTSFINMAHSI